MCITLKFIKFFIRLHEKLFTLFKHFPFELNEFDSLHA